MATPINPDHPQSLKERHAADRKKGLVYQDGQGKKAVSTIMASYREMMLNSPKSEKIVKKILDTALDDDHPHQAACLKMAMDRIIPAAAMANIAGASSGKSAVTINITGIGESGVVIDGETGAPEDSGWEDVDG
jgi:hypothetical protein